VNQINKGKLIFAAILLVLTLCFIIASFSYEEPRARMVPLVIGIATLVLGLVSIVHEIRPIQLITRFDMSIIDLSKQVEEEEEVEETLDMKLLGSIGWITGLFVVTFLLGFHIGIIAFMLAFLKARGKIGWIKSTVAAIIVWGLIYFMFEKAMGFSLFKGLFFGEILPLI
jgi:hypothetical protein